MKAGQSVVMDSRRTHGGGQVEAAGPDREGLLEAVLLCPPNLYQGKTIIY